jgi:hypothetical protein
MITRRSIRQHVRSARASALTFEERREALREAENAWERRRAPRAPIAEDASRDVTPSSHTGAP